MKEFKPKLRLIIKYYAPLLERYARILTRDAGAAATIAQQVLEDQYETDQLAALKNLRNILKTQTLNICVQYNKAKTFNSGVCKIPGRKTSTLYTTTI